MVIQLSGAHNPLFLMRADTRAPPRSFIIKTKPIEFSPAVRAPEWFHLLWVWIGRRLRIAPYVFPEYRGAYVFWNLDVIRQE